VFGVLVNTVVKSVERKVSIQVFLKDGAPTADVNALQRYLLADSLVKTVDYTSKAEALERFKKSHEDVDFALGQQLGSTGMAPLYGKRALPKKLQTRIDELVLGPGAAPAVPTQAEAIEHQAFDGMSLDHFMASSATTLQDRGNLIALLEYLRLRHFRTALFLPKEPTLTGWLAADENGYLENFSEIRVEMQPPSSFLQVIESKNFCMGQLLSPTDRKAAAAIGAKDNPAILLPIILMNRVVAIICVVDSLERLTRSLNELQKIAVKSAMAFEILIMKNKIQMV